MHALSRRQSREVDRIAVEELGIPSIVLMEHAALGVRDFVRAFALHDIADDFPQITILCGKGNNGGDGLAAARLLHNESHHVRVLLVDRPEQFTGEAGTQLRIVQNMELDIDQADAFLADDQPITGVFIDAVYGTGFRPPSQIDFRSINDRVCRGGAYVVSVDVPSGMDADTGVVVEGNAIVAHTTVTMMTLKLGFEQADSVRFTGRCFTVGLGLPFDVVERASRSVR